MNETQSTEVNEIDVLHFCGKVDRRLLDHNRSNEFQWKTFCRVREGKKYFRVDRYEIHGGHDCQNCGVYFLVEKSTGNILKPKSYSGGPCRGVRGNIRDEDFWNKSLTPYGTVYLNR